MSTAITQPLHDIAESPPTAAGVLDLLPLDTIDAEGRPAWRGFLAPGVTRQPLTGLTVLFRMWKPFHEAGKSPGESIRANALACFPEGSYEHAFLREELRRADSMQRRTFADHERRCLRAEMERTSEPALEQMYGVLLDALTDLVNVQRDRTSEIYLDGDDPRKAEWLVRNTWQFLNAHHALVQLHRRIKELMERRMKILERTAGCISEASVQSDGHDDFA